MDIFFIFSLYPYCILFSVCIFHFLFRYFAVFSIFSFTPSFRCCCCCCFFVCFFCFVFSSSFSYIFFSLLAYLFLYFFSFLSYIPLLFKLFSTFFPLSLFPLYMAISFVHCPVSDTFSGENVLQIGREKKERNIFVQETKNKQKINQ